MTAATTFDPSASAPALAAVRPGRADSDPAAVADAVARAAWTAIAEPGDGVAGSLVAELGAAEALRFALDDDGSRRVPAIRAALERWRPRLDAAITPATLAAAARQHVRLLVPGDPDWPPGLGDLGAFSPIALWALAPDGPIPSLERSIALVGARAATTYGERIAMDAAAGLADRGFVIVSGAAYGIDGTAHRSTLASAGTTVAVLAGGLDRFYPSGHQALLHRIATTGAVLSELPCGSAPTKWRFLQRNRLIAAMSRATVVLEAGARSGSLNTANHASALGRPLGAVPGSVFSAASAGCHRLLRERDATCVRDAADMAELATGITPDAPTFDGLDVDPAQRRVLDAVTRTPRDALEIARRSGLSGADTTAALGLLELEGSVRRETGGWRRA
jgi:DNA processing protein